MEHYIEEILDAAQAENKELDGYADTVSYLRERLVGEMGPLIISKGTTEACKDWLRGLAIDILYGNHDIIVWGKECGLLCGDASDGDEEMFIEEYWELMGMALEQLVFPGCCTNSL